MLLFAAHQGEEFVLILPGIMLVAAFLIMWWANQPPPDENSEDLSDEPEHIDVAETVQQPPTTNGVVQVDQEPEPVKTAGDAPN